MAKGLIIIRNNIHANVHRTGRSAWRAMLAVALFASFAIPGAPLWGQANTIQVPAATPLSVELVQHVPMKIGEPLEGRLLYPVYVDNRIAIPAGTILRGKVAHLHTDRSRRIRSRLRGDFTPFHIPVVRFDQLILADGTSWSMRSDDARNGAPLLHLSTPAGKKKRSFLAQLLAEQKQRLQADAALITAPGKADRLVQFLYTQLPYHPERIETRTAWTVELAEPLQVIPAPPIPFATETIDRKKEHPGDTDAAPAPEDHEGWQISSYLQQAISSSNQKAGNRFEAVVAEPVFNADRSLVVPEGSVLVGEVTQAKPARSFGRSGKLRFRFRELRLPTGFSQPVEGTVSGIDTSKPAALKMDSEGGLQPQSQNRAVVPLLLGILAGRALDDDGSKLLNNGVASNGFGIVGRLVGILANSRNVAAGIGFYAAALSMYDLWLAHGHDVSFARNTRIVIMTTPARKPIASEGNQASPLNAPAH